MSGGSGVAPPRSRLLADPLGVVADLVARVEPALDRAKIEDVVAGVAGGRAKRRRLAHALIDNPAVLIDGRSPAPRVVGDLLLALRRAGAAAVSPPICAECGKALGSMQRRGEDWFCGVLRSRARTLRRLREHTAGGLPGPRRTTPMRQLPARDGADPVDVIVDVVTASTPPCPPRS